MATRGGPLPSRERDTTDLLPAGAAWRSAADHGTEPVWRQAQVHQGTGACAELKVHFRHTTAGTDRRAPPLGGHSGRSTWPRRYANGCRTRSGPRGDSVVAGRRGCCLRRRRRREQMALPVASSAATPTEVSASLLARLLIRLERIHR